MLKHRVIGAAIIGVLLLMLVPVPSQAAPWTGEQLSGPASVFFTKIERWWSLLLNGLESPSSPERPAWQKNGCGMDPNGKPQCDPGPGGQGPTTAPAGPS